MSDTRQRGKNVRDIRCDLHHVHLFASNLDESVRFYQQMFGGEVLLDTELAGSRNVLVRLGSACINFYDQPPRDTGRGAVHHLGIRTDDLEGLVAHMEEKGFRFRRGIRDFGELRYIMAAGPDGVLLELFQTSVF